MMNKNIYETPKSDVSDPNSKNGSFVRGVIWGVLIDLGGTTLVGIVFVFIKSFYLASQGMNKDAITTQISKFDPHSASGIALSLIGLTLSFTAGYVCAKKAGKSALKSVYTLCVLSGSYSLYFGGGTYSNIENVFLMIVTVGAIYSGGRVWLRKA